MRVRVGSGFKLLDSLLCYSRTAQTAKEKGHFKLLHPIEHAPLNAIDTLNSLPTKD